MILVTGGTGFLGRHVVNALCAAREASKGQEPVRVLARRPHVELPEGAEAVKGDVLEPDALEAAFEGVEQVVHMAGRVLRAPRDADELYQLHVEGTQNVLAAAARAGVKRFVHVSTSGTTAVSEHADPIPDETAPYAIEVVRRWPYYLSKIYAERSAFEAFDPGVLVPDGGRVKVPVVVVSPSLILGPGDEGLSSSLEIVRFLRREIPATPSGGVNFIDVRDAAAGVLAALERGQPGERYLLGGANMTLEAFFLMLERVSGVPAPNFAVPHKASDLAARTLGQLESVFGLEGEEATSIEMGARFWYVNSQKARHELGLATRPPEATLRDAVDWIRSRGPLPTTKGILARTLRLLGRTVASR